MVAIIKTIRQKMRCPTITYRRMMMYLHIVGNVSLASSLQYLLVLEGLLSEKTFLRVVNLAARRNQQRNTT